MRPTEIPESQTFDCFLSHNSRDKPAMRALAVELRERGFLVWLDEERLRLRLSWQPLLEASIGASRTASVRVGQLDRPDGPQPRWRL